jgi:ribonuclease P protein component
VRERDSRFAVVERLKRRADFRAVAGGTRASGRSFVLQALRRAQDGAIRVGFTVSRQVGNAVERNRVRRRLREMVKLSAAAGAVQLCPGHDYVLIGRRAALAVPFGEMMQELDVALSRLQARGSRGTGGGRHGPLHEPGSPSPAGKPQRGRSRPSKSPENPPQER